MPFSSSRVRATFRWCQQDYLELVETLSRGEKSVFRFSDQLETSHRGEVVRACHTYVKWANFERFCWNVMNSFEKFADFSVADKAKLNCVWWRRRQAARQWHNTQTIPVRFSLCVMKFSMNFECKTIWNFVCDRTYLIAEMCDGIHNVISKSRAWWTWKKPVFFALFCLLFFSQKLVALTRIFLISNKKKIFFFSFKKVQTHLHFRSEFTIMQEKLGGKTLALNKNFK